MSLNMYYTKEESGYNGFSLYIKKVGEVDLLTPKEEIALAELIKKGGTAGAEARDRMIRANLRLVVKIARSYEDYGLPLLDLINEGNLGLMVAIKRFDPIKGAKLSTYASWWIKQGIRIALANQSRTIRLPVHIVEKVFRLRRARNSLERDLGRSATDHELAEELGISAERVHNLEQSALSPTSLDAPVSDEETDLRHELIADEQCEIPGDNIDGDLASRRLHELIRALDPREAVILQYRYGLQGSSEQTLEEIGKRFGVTRERIRQIHNRTLRKLRKKLQETYD